MADDQTTEAASTRTLRVHALFRLPSLDGAVGGVSKVEAREPFQLTQAYHDSEDLRLFRWGVTLQRCEGGPDEGWLLTLPPEATKEAIRLPLDAGAVGEVPDELRDIVTALVRDAPLVPVAVLRTARTTHELSDLNGEPFIEIIDDVVSILDGDHVAARFREVLVQGLDPATEQVVGDVTELLIEYGALPGSGSRAVNALGPRAAAPPDVVLRGPVCPADPAAAAVRAHLALQVTRFLMQDTRVRRDLPDSVHQMRVAARRLRSGLKVFGPLLDEEWALHLRTELGWAAGELGRVRDTEVMLARLDDHAEDLPPADSQLATVVVERVLRADLAQARQDALASLRSPRHTDLLVALVDAANHPHLTELANEPCEDVLPPMVAKAYRRLSRDVAGLHIDSPAEPWHETRIAAKKARYAAELVMPVFGEPAKRLAKALAEVTENLGDHQDCHVAQLELRRIAMRDDVDGATGFALGLLHAAEEERELSLREDFAMLWPQVQKLYRRTELV